MLMKPLVSLMVLSFLLRNAYETCVFSLFFSKMNKRILIKLVVFFVVESPMSLRHYCEPFGGHQVAEKAEDSLETQ